MDAFACGVGMKLYAARLQGDLLAVAGEIVDEDEESFLVTMPGFEPELLSKADGWYAVSSFEIFNHGQ